MLEGNGYHEYTRAISHNPTMLAVAGSRFTTLDVRAFVVMHRGP